MKHPLVAVEAIPDVGAKSVDFFGRPALVYRVGTELCATVAICPHVGGPLELKDGVLVCAWHGQRHDATTGACLGGPAPAQRALRLPTQVEDGMLQYVWGE
jgi:nitrite reductase/ring-hydroxylating ferredoxin subunit